MKKNVALFFSVLITGTLLISCGDKTEEVPYANLTVEQNKAKIQEEGLAMVQKLNGMSDLSGMFALMNLEQLISYSTLTGDPVEVAVRQLITPLLKLEKNVLGLTQLRSTAVTIETISDVMAKAGGVYTYNRSTESFDRVANTSKIEFIFPIGYSTSNNGKLTIDNVTAKTSEMVITQLPKSMDMKLSKAGSELLSFSFRAAYDAYDVPTSWSTTLNCVEGYKFTQSMDNTESDVTWQFAYTLNNENMLSGKFSSKGDFTYDAMNNPGNLDNIDWIDQVVDNANVLVQLGNLKLTGIADVNKMKTAFDAAFPKGETESEADVTKLCQLLNSNVTLVLLYAKEGTAIAKSNFYVNEDSYWDYDSELNKWVERTWYEPSMQFIFKDNSAMDDSFFESGFENLLDAFEEMMFAMQMNYAE